MKNLLILFCGLSVFMLSAGISIADDTECSIHIGSNNHQFTSQNLSCNDLNIIIRRNFASEISSTIQRLKNVKKITISDECNDIYLDDNADQKMCSSKNINIPIELFSLPNLEELTLVGGVNYTVHAADHKNTIHSSIRKINIHRAGQGDFSFLPKLDNVIEANVKISTDSGGKCENLREIPEYIYNMKNIKKLSVTMNDVPLKLNSHICTMRNLEELNFYRTIVDIPLCKNRMDKIKTVAMHYCGKKEKINGEEYYFPSRLLQFKNIKNLNITSCGRFEMPPYGLKNLRYFQLGDCLQDDIVCQAACAGHPMGGINVINILRYPNIERIVVGKRDIFDYTIGNLSPINSWGADPKFDKIWNAGQKKFIKNLSAAFKGGKVPHLKEVLIPDINAPDPMQIFLFKNEQSH